MSFDAPAEYGRFMGRYSSLLAVPFAAFAQVEAGQRALDVGCGTGELTAVLAARLGPGAVAAADPSPAFADFTRSRLPGVDVRRAAAEELPYPDGSFGVTLAQLVVHFMTDPVAGLREMRRVTRPGGVVAACVWDHAGGGGPLTVFWQAVRSLDPSAPGEAGLAGAREGHLAELFDEAGLPGAESAILTVTSAFAGFEEWWEPYTLGVGPAGDYVRSLDDRRRADLRARCASLLPSHGPITITATAWAVRSLFTGSSNAASNAGPGP
ncbi:methyltransferase [Actinoplanes sp. OR16]|uniref:class I SAM-dependent methyltransferase n=1 Tax=Actinoplanes sp. OR16 TaxID=946334 RepID=UPI000F71E0CD|nr:class I SAM-dependent methyltransferase [Actinoplanes sp. OR16]BBH69783.1 methyltransferase [Actinoplanes sp. OR16]